MKISKKIISFSSLALLVFSLFLVSCDEDVTNEDVIGGVDYVSIEAVKFAWVPEGETASVEVKVVASRANSADRVIALQQIDGTANDNVLDADPSNYTIPASVTIPAGDVEGTFNVDITADDFAKKKITISLVPDPSYNLAVVDWSEVELEDESVVVEEVDYGRLVIYAQRPCTETIVTLEITTDDWPEETSWELYDLNGTPTVIASGGPYDGQDNTTITSEFCLASGNYGIAVYDAYGDGIPGGGYQVSAGGVVLTSGPVLGTGSSSTFTVD